MKSPILSSSIRMVIFFLKNKIFLIIGASLLILSIPFFHHSKKAQALVSKVTTKATIHEFSTPIDPIEAGTQKLPNDKTTARENVLTNLLSTAPPCPMRIYAAPPSHENNVSSSCLPYGRMIKCVLVNTVDSSRIATPIIGMVLEDVYQNGICVIPAGTEVHGTAQIDRSRERIASEKDWIVVWQDGREMPVKGIALSNTQHGTQEKWGITDGSAGLEGEILKSDKMAQLKEILATTIAAAGAGLVPVTTTTSPFGNTQVSTTGSAQAVLGSSIQEAGKVYAEQIMQSIERDGWFVRCAAGSKFYLYTLEAIDAANAHIKSGGSSS